MSVARTLALLALTGVASTTTLAQSGGGRPVPVDESLGKVLGAISR